MPPTHLCIAPRHPISQVGGASSLSWLLLLNTIYTFFDDPAWTMPFPKMWNLVLMGAGLGLVQMVLMFTGITNFMLMPITFGSLPFDLVFFTGGILAKRNNWLDAIHKLESGSIQFVKLFTIGFALAIYAFTVTSYAETLTGNPFMLSNEGDDGKTDDDDGAPAPTSLGYVIVIGVITILSGIFTFTCSIAAMHLFYQNFNSTGPYSKYFSECVTFPSIEIQSQLHHYHMKFKIN